MPNISQKSWENINEILYYLSDIDDINEYRKIFLQELRKLIYFDLADFSLCDFQVGKNISLVDPVVISKYSKEFEDEFMFKYDKEFEVFDYARWIFSSPFSVVFRESDMITEKYRNVSPYYTDYLQPLGLVNVLGISIASKGLRLGAVNLHRGNKLGDYSEDDIYIMEQFIPHLEKKLLKRRETEGDKFDKFIVVAKTVSNKYKLSKREIEIIKLVCLGNSNKEISDELYIAENTVKKHLTNIMAKLEVTNRIQLISLMLRYERKIFWGD